MASKRLPKYITTLLKFASTDPGRPLLHGIMFDRVLGLMIACDGKSALFIKTDDPFHYAAILAEAKGLPPISMAAATSYRNYMKNNVGELVPPEPVFHDGLPDRIRIADMGKADGGWQYVTHPYPTIFNTIPFGVHTYKGGVHYHKSMEPRIKAVESLTGVPTSLHPTVDGCSPYIHYAHKGALHVAMVIMPVRLHRDDYNDPELMQEFVVLDHADAPDPSLVKFWAKVKAEA